MACQGLKVQRGQMTHTGTHSISAIVVMVERGQAFRRETACGAEGQGWLGWGAGNG